MHVSAPGAGRVGPSAGAIAGTAVRAGARDGAVCPNLLQRPGSGQNAGRETLIFRASSRRRSRPGAPLQQIRTRPRPGSPQEPHPHHPVPTHPRHHAVPGRSGEFSGEKVPLRLLGTGGVRRGAKSTCRPPFRAAGPLTHRFTRVRYALLPLLRLFTLHCTRRRSAAEGEGAQQTRRGAADDPARPPADPGAAGQEPRGTTAPRDSSGNPPRSPPGNPPDSPAFQRERPTGPAPRTRETHSDTSITIFPCAAERHRAPGGRCSPVFAPDCAARGWIPGGSGGILYVCSNFVAPRPLPHRRVRGTGAPRTGPPVSPTSSMVSAPSTPPVSPTPAAPPISTASSKRARGSARGDWRPWPPAGRWRRSSSG